MKSFWPLVLSISCSHSMSYYYDYPTLHHGGQPVEYAYGVNNLNNKFDLSDAQVTGLLPFANAQLDPSLSPQGDSAMDNYLTPNLAWQTRMPDVDGQNPYQFHMIDCQMPCDTDTSDRDMWSDLTSNHTAWLRVGNVMRNSYWQLLQDAQTNGTPLTMNSTAFNFKFAMTVYTAGDANNLISNPDKCTTVLLEGLAGLVDWATFINFFNVGGYGDGDTMITAGDYCKCPTKDYFSLTNSFRGAKMVIFHGDTAAWRLSLLANGPSCV